MSKWPWPQRLTRITRSWPASFAASASSKTTRSACAGSGAGMMPSTWAKRTAASKAAVWAIARAHGRRHEVVAERVHRHQRRQPDGVPEVVPVGAAGQGGTGGRLGGHEAGVEPLAKAPDQWIGDA